MTERGINLPASGPERDRTVSDIGKGALAGGALAILLGTKTGRRLGKSTLKLGALAAIGTLGYKAYRNWQSQKTPDSHGNSQGSTSIVPEEIAGHFTHELSDQAADVRCQLLLRAMMGAIKADGHIDDQERQRIQLQIKELNLSPDAKTLLESEINAPIDVEETARGAGTLPAKIETYLAAAFVIDIDHPAEREYLDRLGEALGLDRGLMRSIETELND